DHRELVIVGQDPATKEPIGASDADHAVWVEFRGTQRAHARRATHLDSLGQGKQNFLVPDRWNVAEMSVDDSDAPVAGFDGPEHRTHRGRSEAPDSRWSRFAMERWPYEHARFHDCSASKACIRGPGVYPAC